MSLPFSKFSHSFHLVSHDKMGVSGDGQPESRPGREPGLVLRAEEQVEEGGQEETR